MGLFKAEQSHLGEVAVRPCLMIPSPAPALLLLAFAQDAAQTHAHPPVHGGKGILVRVLVVTEPASENRIQGCDDRGHTVAVGSFRFPADGLAEFPQTFLPHVTPPSNEAIPQEVESFAVGD